MNARFVKTCLVLLAAWGMIVIGPGVGVAQIGGSGSITGTISDPTGAVIPGATVEAANVATGIKTTRQTTDTGVYTISPLDPGKYTVTVSVSGFKSLIQENVVVDALSNIGLNLTLEVGAPAEQVVVTDAAQPLNTNDARLGTTIRNEVYTALPLSMGSGAPRDPTAFISLAPGVQGIARWGNFSGGQDFSNEQYVDGVPITNAVAQGEGRNLQLGISVEAIDQFQVETSGTSVQFSGQGASNFVVKSGTKNFTARCLSSSETKRSTREGSSRRSAGRIIKTSSASTSAAPLSGTVSSSSRRMTVIASASSRPRRSSRCQRSRCVTEISARSQHPSLTR